MSRDTIPHADYPRPQLRREDFTILNGWWDCDFTAAGHEPDEWPHRILVPFSPETEASGVGRQLLPTETLWYRRPLQAEILTGHRALLHFGAVDQECRVRLDGVELAHHLGGYLPFMVDVTDALADGQAHELVVEVRDLSDTSHRSVGKQRLRRGGIWYTAQSGIWQTVWLEIVPDLHISALRMRTPDAREGADTVDLWLQVDASDAGIHPVTVTIAATPTITVQARTGSEFAVSIPAPRLWSPDDPHLYDLTVALADDRVDSYAGLRSVALERDPEGLPRLFLNGSPFPHIGVLDQGYWPDGLYTAPDDAAFESDILAMKDLGFTMLRKHIKIEPQRWYHHCDRLGMLVWQDMVNGGTRYNPAVITTPVISPRISLSDRRHRIFGRADAGGRAEFLHELDATVELLRNAPSVVAWVPFNEGWGQFDAAAAVDRIRGLDPDRLIDHASGWHDQRAGDMRSLHVYFQPIRPARWWGRDGRALVVSEYGGYSLRLPGHRYPKKEFGYRRYSTAAEFTAGYARLQEREVLPAIDRGLSATVYTQLADVEDESNGLLTADRTALKPDAEVVRALNAEFRRRFAAATGAPAPPEKEQP